MTDKAKKDQTRKAEKKPRRLAAKEVRNYLADHPDFFDRHGDLLGLLRPAREMRTDGVVDFQAVLLERLQQEVVDLHDAREELIHASRGNMTTQARMHAAVLCLLEAETFDHLCHIVCNDWVDMLQVDAITLCFETDPKIKLPPNSNIRALAPGVIDGFMGHETSAILRGDVTPAQEIFGPATALIKAEALIRIEKSTHYPLGLLAFGSRDKDCFTPGQGTELLRFLEAAFHSQLAKILKRAA